MSTLTTAPLSPSLDSRPAPSPSVPRLRSVRGLAGMLLAAVVAALVVVADRVINTWADQHLFLAWVVLWAVVFAAMALFADVARGLAQRVLRALDGWSRTLAEARAEARLWEMAQSNPRLMRELQLARQRQHEDFESALAPLGIEPAATIPRTKGWIGFAERLAESRARQRGLYYI
ncbi:MAG TPA: hypothetical protein PKC60_05570 [Hydrogenophaga sp.]|uniref:hypothetical protein n=1 Tax=Hydrogenophaga sp. TaxID=1904254 RepID=UPI002C69A58C|nr:hypothetical protein [Hydrogenophaga sp.]HMN92684.1 hypothetical protein [Hydrogenophaga sp.]HMP09267.1 hypothetical protein [Hydrogenophaga sp.]